MNALLETPDVERDEFGDPLPVPGKDYRPVFDADFRESFADMRWIVESFNAGLLKPYDGKFIAVARGTVLGVGDDPHELRAKVLRETGLPLNRLVVEYIEYATCIEC